MKWWNDCKSLQSIYSYSCSIWSVNFLGIFLINTLIFSYPCNENSFGITTARASYFPFWLYVGFACFLMYVYFKGKSLLWSKTNSRRISIFFCCCSLPSLFFVLKHGMLCWCCNVVGPLFLSQESILWNVRRVLFFRLFNI